MIIELISHWKLSSETPFLAALVESTGTLKEARTKLVTVDMVELVDGTRDSFIIAPFHLLFSEITDIPESFESTLRKFRYSRSRMVSLERVQKVGLVPTRENTPLRLPIGYPYIAVPSFRLDIPRDIIETFAELFNSKLGKHKSLNLDKIKELDRWSNFMYPAEEHGGTAIQNKSA